MVFHRSGTPPGGLNGDLAMRTRTSAAASRKRHEAKIDEPR